MMILDFFRDASFIRYNVKNRKFFSKFSVGGRGVMGGEFCRFVLRLRVIVFWEGNSVGLVLDSVILFLRILEKFLFIRVESDARDNF